MRSIILRWARYVARMGRRKVPEIDHFEDLCIDGRIILKWILRKLVGVDWIVLTEVQVAGCFERGAENAGSIKCGKFPYQLRAC
jgi:hypothetical protein